MPVKELGPPFQFVSWRVPQFPRAIEYPLEVMEEIRAFACDELLQLSHGGDEVAGVLFGTRRDDLIRILTWRPIACDHTQGEGLRLSYNDRMNLAVQLEVARQNPDLRDLRPAGWFVSHASGSVSLSPSDLEIYNAFFPEAWQVAMVICPKGGGLAQAGFFVRESDQRILTEASYHCFDLEPLHLPLNTTPLPAQPASSVEPEQPVPAAQPVLAEQPVPVVQPVLAEQPVPVARLVPTEQPAPAAQPVLAEQPVPVVQPVLAEQTVPVARLVPAEQPVPVAQPVLAEQTVLAAETIPTAHLEPLPAANHPRPPIADVLSRPEPRKPAPHAPETPAPVVQTPSLETPSFETPSFQVDDQVPTRERWLWAIPIVLALGIAAFLLNQRRDASPNASIALRALAESQTVQLAWDANSRAIRDSDSGEIEITDGGKSSEVSLTADQLRAGKLSYLPQSSDVSFVMTIHPSNGEPMHDSTRLIAPVFNTPAQAPQLLPASPAPASAPEPPPPADQGALEERVRQLTGAVVKERARADDLQNLVRILENRLGMSSSAPNTEPHP